MAFSEKRSESRSELECKNISILSGVQLLTSTDLKLSYFKIYYVSHADLAKRDLQNSM